MAIVTTDVNELTHQAEALAYLFVASTDGSDAQRHHMASYLGQHQQLTSSKLWLNGAWQEKPPLVTYKIVPKPAATESSERLYEKCLLVFNYANRLAMSRIMAI